MKILSRCARAAARIGGKLAAALVLAAGIVGVAGVAGMAAAAPAAAIPSGNGQDNNVTVPTYPTTGQTAYGTYQNPHKSR